MPKSSNHKLKILYIYDILKSNTDAEHGVTLKYILAALERLDIYAERKSVYDDIAQLTDIYGADIQLVRNGKESEYRMMSHDFELPELKLLVDAVESSKFITHKKSGELIKKLESLTSKYEANKLQGQVHVQNRIKTMNETIYYNVDAINSAIISRLDIQFNYFEWTPQRQKKLRRNGEFYTVSPQVLSWDNENYYLIAYDRKECKIKHYRVDKMLKITCIDVPCVKIESFDAATYSKGVFGMFGGEEKRVTLCCDNSLAGAVIDRFGQEIMTVPHGECFTVTVKVQISPQFFAWLCGLGDKIQIQAPDDVKQEFIEHIRKIYNSY